MRVVLVDDERLARKELSELLEKLPSLEIIGECGNAEEAKILIENEHPELIFLDIQMPEKNGFELLEELDFIPKVIFVTAYDEYAIKAFEVNAFDYLLKPVEEERFIETVQRLINEENEKNKASIVIRHERLGQDDQIFLKDGDKCWFVALKNIRMFESEGNYVRVFFDSNKPLILKSLNNLEERLDHTFFRANRKFIVNLRWVQDVENWFNGGLKLTLKDGSTVEVSRRQSSRFRDMMGI